ncbi:MAG: Hsp20/alpha crystallin family protein [Cyanobacteria bacterium]|nr:Hsp20/alpha crystallin family protein [Cyanobacteriota bacterium]
MGSQRRGMKSPFRLLDEDFSVFKSQINQWFDQTMNASAGHYPEQYAATEGGLGNETHSGAPTTLSLPVELLETPKAFVVYALLPGVNEHEIDIQVKGQELVITAIFRPRDARELERHGLDEAESILHLMEFRYGKVRRNISFNKPILANEVQALYHQGMLRLNIPKKLTQLYDQPHSIKIQPMNPFYV